MMYISYQGQQAIHQDVVNDAVRRSERRRMLAEQVMESDARVRTGKPGTGLTALVRSMVGLVARS
jgi:ATP-dependent exoDNAse (exonuclease V) alpha subunit